MCFEIHRDRHSIKTHTYYIIASEGAYTHIYTRMHIHTLDVHRNACVLSCIETGIEVKVCDRASKRNLCTN